MRFQARISTMRTFFKTVFVLGCAMHGIAPSNSSCSAQGIPVQLPVVNQFRISTVVSVPDAGATRLGGIRSGAMGTTSSGLPMGSGPLFHNRAMGSSYSAGNASLHARIFLTSEMDADVMAEAERRILARRAIDPNGAPDVQQKADFISRNIGRR